MKDSGLRIPDGEAPAEGSPRAPGTGPGDGTRPRAFPGHTRRDLMCRICRVTLQPGHRAVRFPCGQGLYVLVLVLHARCVVEALARGAAPAPLRCPPVKCGAQHPRLDALEAAVEADSGLRIGAARWEGRLQATRAYGVGGFRVDGTEQPGCRVTTQCFLG